MKSTAALLLTALASFALVPAPSANAQRKPDAKSEANVPVTAVVLFSSGVGYFEHEGTVKGASSTELQFKANQINDILKSLVLQESGKGNVSSVTYPSQDPLEKTLKSFQVDITRNPPLAELLNQLRGAKVVAKVGAETLTGVILGVEKQRRPVGKDKALDVHVLNLIVGGMIRSVPLDDTRTIDLDDPQLQQELQKALAALAQARDQDKKPVVINFTGDGERQVRIGYIVETPVWKTSYRCILPSDDKKKPALQGWAIVENQTDNDWNDVKLSLVSGRPTSFIQDLYQPLYVPRPVVQPELYSSLRPQTYDDGIRGLQETDKLRKAPEGAKGVAPGKARDAAAQRRAKAQEAESLGLALAAPAAKLMDITASIESVATAKNVGELFEYSIGAVTLPRQRSAMLPIITDDIEAQRISIYNQSVLAKNPLNGLQLNNNTGKHLLQGPVTVFDENQYAGDAQIDNVPPGQQRLISYGIDLQVLVDATKNTNTSAIQTAKIVKGVLQFTHKRVATQSYLADNKSEKAKTLIIEHPFRQGWSLADTAKPGETTDKLYRFKVAIGPKEQQIFTVKEELVDGQTIEILPLDLGALQGYSKTGAIPREVRDVFAKAIQLKSAMVDTDREITERKKQIQQITQEQNRIRDNMKTVTKGATSDYYNRLLKKLNDQETDIEKLQGEIDNLQKLRDRQSKELETFLMNTTVG